MYYKIISKSICKRYRRLYTNNYVTTMRQSKGIFKFDNLSCKMHEKEQKVDENVYEL